MWRPFRRPKPLESDADASAEQALRALIDAKAQRLKANDLARRFDQAKQRNHFGEAVTRAMQRGHNS